MRLFKQPSSVSLAFLAQDTESRPKSPIVSVSQPCDNIQPDKNVIVVMIWIVEAKPGSVPLVAVANQASLKIEFRASLNRVSDPSSSLRFWKSRERRKGFPAV